LSEHAVRFAEPIVWFAEPIVRDRKPPIRARYVVGNLDLAVLCCFVERVLEGIDEEFGDY
jgi:hypothetical protein